MILANIIFPALATAYVYPVFFPFLVVLTLVVESRTTARIEPDAGRKTVWLFVIGANLWPRWTPKSGH